MTFDHSQLARLWQSLTQRGGFVPARHQRAFMSSSVRLTHSTGRRPVQIRLEQMKTLIQTEAGNKVRVTMRADGRYLGTLYCKEVERDAILDILKKGADHWSEHTLDLVEREK